MHTISFEAIGTHWEIDISHIPATVSLADVETAIRDRIAVFDQHYSRFRDDSLVAQMNRHPGIYKMPEDSAPMMELYEKLYRATDGLLTPLIGQVLVDSGYDATYSLQMNAPLTRPPRWEDVIVYRPPNIEMKRPALLDFGAAGKGYLVDIVARVLEEFAIHEYCIDAGGDMIHRGSIALRVGLENPLDTAQVIGVAQLKHKSMCASAGNRRAWGAMHHIIHPSTLTPVSDIIAIWVVAESTLLADGLATALFFVSPERLFEYVFEYCIMRRDCSITYSSDFPAVFFVQ